MVAMALYLFNRGETTHFPEQNYSARNHRMQTGISSNRLVTAHMIIPHANARYRTKGESASRTTVR